MHRPLHLRLAIAGTLLGFLTTLAPSAEALVPMDSAPLSSTTTVRAPAPVEYQPSEPILEDSEFDNTPSWELQICRDDGPEFDPPPPPPNDPRCPLSGSSYDGANCYVADVPDGSGGGFVWSNNLYYKYVKNKCPLAGSWYDGANCYYKALPSGALAPHTTAMEWRYYYPSPSYCPMGTRIGSLAGVYSICRVGYAPTGSEGPFVYNNNFYYKALPADNKCPLPGSWDDSANCYVAPVPYGTQGFVWSGNLYYTPYSGPPVELWGLPGQPQMRLRGVTATLYLHGRNATLNAANDGPIYGWAYKTWNNAPRGNQPIWLAWDSTIRINQSIPDVRSKLDLACGAPDLPCHIVCHSAGCLMITRLLSDYPDRWTILSVTALMGAQGGSEIADVRNALPWYIVELAAWFNVTKPIDEDLETNNARSSYDHNQTGGVPITTASGDWVPFDEVDICPWWKWLIPGMNIACAWEEVKSDINNFMRAVFNGNNDGVLAWHSTAGFSSKTGSNTSCRPGTTGGYWTNYESMHNWPRGNCYHGHLGAFHMDGHDILNWLPGIPAR